jgi:hypothetical protein
MAYETIVDGKEWRFESRSNPQREYTVKLNGKNVNNKEQRETLSCSCPSWIYNASKQNKRWCRHCEEILKNEIDFTEALDVIERREELYGEHHFATA